jgi:hypothetical protein
MNLKYYLLTAALALGVVGCNQNKDSTLPDQQVVATNTNTLAQTKDQFMAATNKKIKELDAEIDELSQKAAGLKDDAKVQANKAIDVLRADRDIVKQKYDDMNAPGGEWDKTKAAFQAAWADVEKAYDDAKAKFTSSGSSTNSPGNP